MHKAPAWDFVHKTRGVPQMRGAPELSWQRSANLETWGPRPPPIPDVPPTSSHCGQSRGRTLDPVWMDEEKRNNRETTLGMVGRNHASGLMDTRGLMEAPGRGSRPPGSLLTSSTLVSQLEETS